MNEKQEASTKNRGKAFNLSSKTCTYTIITHGLIQFYSLNAQGIPPSRSPNADAKSMSKKKRIRHPTNHLTFYPHHPCLVEADDWQIRLPLTLGSCAP